MGPSGLEPLTPVLSGLCSNQLSYGPELQCNASCVMCNALIHYTIIYTLHNKSEALSLIFFCWRDAPLKIKNSQARLLKRQFQSKPVYGLLRTLGLADNSNFLREKKIRKEVIQPHLPVRLPCYDLAPVTDFTLGPNCLEILGTLSSHRLTGGVYKARERIHGGVADPPLLAIPAS